MTFRIAQKSANGHGRKITSPSNIHSNNVSEHTHLNIPVKRDFVSWLSTKCARTVRAGTFFAAKPLNRGNSLTFRVMMALHASQSSGYHSSTGRSKERELYTPTMQQTVLMVCLE